MAKAEATVEELVGMIERGELRLPEMQRRYVWRSPRVRDLLDSLYRGYPSGASCSGKLMKRYHSSNLRLSSRKTPTKALACCSTANKD